jgi:hypothetical protein
MPKLLEKKICKSENGKGTKIWKNLLLLFLLGFLVAIYIGTIK